MIVYLMMLLEFLNSVALATSLIFIAFTMIRDARRFAISYAVVAVFGLVFYLMFSTIMPFLVMVLSAISVKYLYSRIFYYFTPVLFIIGVALIVMRVDLLIWAIFDLSVGIGTSTSMFTDKQSREKIAANNKSKGTDVKKEVDRDLIQVSAGIIILILLFTMSQKEFRMTLSMAIFPLYMLGNYYSMAPETKLGKTLTFFERPTTPLGLGAIWFAAGILIALGIVNSVLILAIIIFVTTIGDSLATIFGSLLKSPKLPYNRKKSLAGFMAIFLFSGVFGFVLIGWQGLAIALLSAVVESISLHPFDDNFILPVILGAFSYVV